MENRNLRHLRTLFVGAVFKRQVPKKKAGCITGMEENPMITQVKWKNLI